MIDEVRQLLVYDESARKRLTRLGRLRFPTKGGGCNQFNPIMEELPLLYWWGSGMDYVGYGEDNEVVIFELPGSGLGSLDAILTYLKLKGLEVEISSRGLA